MCDCLIALPAHTEKGEMIFGKNSDRAVNEPQYFVTIPGKTWSASEQVHCTYIDVPQCARTYGMLLSKVSWIFGGEMGVNEFGVCIGNEAIYSKCVQKSPGLLGMDLVRLGLERGRTARDAVEEMIVLIEAFGQGGNGSFDGEFYYDNSFLIADGHEVWLLETAGKYWAAKEIKKTCSISNFMNIGKADLLHPKAVAYAKQQGFLVKEPFDFTAAYMDWEGAGNYNGMVRQNSSMRFLEEQKGSINVASTVEILSCHTTEHPFTQGNFSVCKHAEGADRPHQTTSSLVAVLKGEESILWGSGMSIPCISLYKPFWLDVFSSRSVFSYGEQEKGRQYWLRREQLNRRILSGCIEEEGYQKEKDQLQRSWFAMAETITADERQALCEEIADQEEGFIDRWIAYSNSESGSCKSGSMPLGDGQAQEFWQEKNAKLGENKHIVD